eukprot:7512811-Lingulodinium_polyedra.AAC.1
MPMPHVVHVASVSRKMARNIRSRESGERHRRAEPGNTRLSEDDGSMATKLPQISVRARPAS